jgi:hypothetical protein
VDEPAVTWPPPWFGSIRSDSTDVSERVEEIVFAAITVPDFADGAVAELRHGADGTVIADIRIPGPVPDQRPASMLREVAFDLDDDDAELKRVPTRPATEADEAKDVW